MDALLSDKVSQEDLWETKQISGIEASLALQSIDIQIALTDIFEDVNFGEVEK